MKHSPPLQIVLMTLLALAPLTVHAFKAFEIQDQLIIDQPTQSTMLKLPEPMKRSSAYHLTIIQNKPALAESHSNTVGDPELMIAKANQHFQKKNYQAALELLTELHDNYPARARVCAMLGSIFYKLKDNNLARKYWEESLFIDGNQPQVKAYLEKLPPETPQATEPQPEVNS